MSIGSRVDFRYDIMSKLSELGGVGGDILLIERS